MIDSHCHLDDSSFDRDREAVIERANAVGVTGFVVPGVSPINWESVARVECDVAGAKAAYGIHPHYLQDLQAEPLAYVLSRLEEYLQQSCAVGECGLDRKAARNAAQKAKQEEILVAQLHLARRLDLPLILHCVRAHGHLLDVLRTHRVPAAGILHWYSGPAELVRDFVRLGFVFGFGLALGKPGAKKAVAALRAVPRDHVVVETDAPDQPALPGERNEPAALAEVVRIVARLRGDTPDRVAEQSDETVRRVLRW